jgi:hypothetical protein
MSNVPAPRRCRFDATGNTGTILHEIDHLSRYDGELGPWYWVQFDDGLSCWVTQDTVTVFADLALPIKPDAAMTPPESDDEHRVVLEHVSELLRGAAAWIDLLDLTTAPAWLAVAGANEEVERLLNQLPRTT